LPVMAAAVLRGHSRRAVPNGPEWSGIPRCPDPARSGSAGKESPVGTGLSCQPRPCHRSGVAFLGLVRINQVYQEVLQPVGARCRGSGALSIAESVKAAKCGDIHGVAVGSGDRPLEFPRSRDTCKVDPESHQLADLGNDRHVRDQLVHHRPGRNRGLDCGARTRHQNRLVLPAREDLAAIGWGRHHH